MTQIILSRHLRLKFQNDHFSVFGCQSLDSAHVLTVIKYKYSVNIMVIGVTTSDGNTLIISHHLRLNTETYVKCLQEAVLPSWFNGVAAERSYV